MDVKSLAVFVSIADTLNFSRTAEAMHMSVSAVSRCILRLEQELGQQLLTRNRRSTRLTSAGNEFKAYALRTTADWQQLRRKLAAEAELAGEISLYCSVTASYSILAPIIEAFRLNHPAVELMLHTGDQAEGIERVANGEYDVAICGQSQQLPASLEFLPLLESPLQLYAPAMLGSVREAALVAAAKPSLEHWLQVPFIVPERGITATVLSDWFSGMGLKPKIYAQVAGHEAIAAMVGLGFGVALLPDLVVSAGAAGGQVEALKVDAQWPALSIGMCSQRQRLADSLLRSFWEVAEFSYKASF